MHSGTGPDPLEYGTVRDMHSTDKIESDDVKTLQLRVDALALRVLQLERIVRELRNVASTVTPSAEDA